MISKSFKIPNPEIINSNPDLNPTSTKLINQKLNLTQISTKKLFLYIPMFPDFRKFIDGRNKQYSKETCIMNITKVDMYEYSISRKSFRIN